MGGDIISTVVGACIIGLLLMLGAYAFLLLIAAHWASNAAARFERAHGAMIESED